MQRLQREDQQESYISMPQTQEAYVPMPQVDFMPSGGQTPPSVQMSQPFQPNAQMEQDFKSNAQVGQAFQPESQGLGGGALVLMILCSSYFPFVGAELSFCSERNPPEDPFER